MVMASVFRAFLSLFLMAILARYLGVGQFGIFSFAIAFGEFFIFLADFGLPIVFIRDTAARAHTDEAQVLYSNGLAAQFISITITYCLIIASASLFVASKESFTLILLLTCAVMLGILTRMGAGVFRIFDRMQFEAISVTFERFLTLILVGAAVLFKGDIRHLALAWVAGSLGGYLATLWMIHHNFLQFRLSAVTVPRVVRFFRQAAPLALASFFTALKDRGGVIILQALAGSVALGLFSAAYRLLALPYAFAVSFQSTIISIFSRLTAGSSESLQEIYKASLRLALVMGFIFQAMVMFMAPWAISLIYGEGFRDSLLILQVLSLTIIPIFGYLVTTSLLVARKQNKPMLWAWVAAGLANVILSWLLCPSLGAKGLAWSLVISEFVLFSINYLVIKFTFVSGELWVPVAKNFGAIAISGLIYIVLIQFGSVPLVSSIIEAGVYLTSLAVLRIVTLKELAYFTSSRII
jgi:O-antigen/teichoic acid export membrane protein